MLCKVNIDMCIYNIYIYTYISKCPSRFTM